MPRHHASRDCARPAHGKGCLGPAPLPDHRGRRGVDDRVLKRLVTASRTGQIPVVVVSGSITEADEARVAELGAVAFLRKPADPKTLHETLSRAAGQTP